MTGFLDTAEQFLGAGLVIVATGIVVLDNTSNNICRAELEVLKPVHALHVVEIF